MMHAVNLAILLMSYHIKSEIKDLAHRVNNHFMVDLPESKFNLEVGGDVQGWRIQLIAQNILDLYLKKLLENQNLINYKDFAKKCPDWLSIIRNFKYANTNLVQ